MPMTIRYLVVLMLGLAPKVLKLIFGAEEGSQMEMPSLSPRPGSSYGAARQVSLTAVDSAAVLVILLSSVCSGQSPNGYLALRLRRQSYLTGAGYKLSHSCQRSRPGWRFLIARPPFPNHQRVRLKPRVNVRPCLGIQRIFLSREVYPPATLPQTSATSHYMLLMQ